MKLAREGNNQNISLVLMLKLRSPYQLI